MGDTERNPLELSDEEIMNMAEPSEIIEEEEETETTNTNEEGEENGNEETTNELERDSDEEETSESETEDDIDIESDGESEPETTEDQNTGSSQEALDDSEEDSSDNEEEETKTVDNSIDYEGEYKKVFAPFRANGRDVQVQNADQAIQLMQMGAGYNEKMAGLKPSLKILKMLENNSLLNEEKINYLIDLDKKDPDAITKLMKDSGIDPLEVDLESSTEYRPNTYNVDDKQVELDGVLAEIQHTDSYANTIDVIGNKWDDSSKRALYENPAEIKIINDQMASGVFDEINIVLQNQKMLGNLNGLSDRDAYLKIGTYMQQNKLFKAQQNMPANTSNTGVGIPVKSNAPNPKLKKRKQAASSTKSVPSSSGVKKDFNPLSLSDDEFDKITTPQI